MLKVIVVDDEKVVLQGVSLILGKQSELCQVVGTAQSGLKGLELIENLKPDVVITDIKMPDMCGIELLKQAKMKFPHLFVIMLSGHSEFDLAQNAIKYGAYDYLLKPCKHKHITEVLKKIVEEIKGRTFIENEYRSIKKELICNREMIKNNRMKDVLLNLNGHEVNLDLKSAMVIVLEECEKHKEWNKNCHGLYLKFLEECGQLWKTQNLRIKNQKIIIITGCDNLNILKDKLYQLKISFNRQGSLIVGAFSSLEGNQESLNSAYLACGEMIDYLRFNEKYEIGMSQQVIDAFEPEEFNALFDEDKVFNPVFKGEHQVVRSFTSSLFERLRTLSTTYSHKKTKMKMIQLMVLIEMRLNNNNLSLDQIFGHSVDYIYDIEQMTKLNDLLTYIGTMLIDVAVYIDRGNANIPTSIRQAIDYIETHFNEDISMQDVAEIVYLNPWYFSELFREKTGITFTDYITNTRIDNAKRLLRQSRLKNFEIAGRVGFDNASYFNYIFKKKVGITPRTYRQMI